MESNDYRRPEETQHNRKNREFGFNTLYSPMVSDEQSKYSSRLLSGVLPTTVNSVITPKHNYPDMIFFS